MFGSVSYSAVQLIGDGVVAAGLAYANVIVGYAPDSRRATDLSAAE